MRKNWCVWYMPLSMIAGGLYTTLITYFWSLTPHDIFTQPGVPGYQFEVLALLTLALSPAFYVIIGGVAYLYGRKPISAIIAGIFAAEGWEIGGGLITPANIVHYPLEAFIFMGIVSPSIGLLFGGLGGLIAEWLLKRKSRKATPPT